MEITWDTVLWVGSVIGTAVASPYLLKLFGLWERFMKTRTLLIEQVQKSEAEKARTHEEIIQRGYQALLDRVNAEQSKNDARLDKIVAAFERETEEGRRAFKEALVEIQADNDNGRQEHKAALNAILAHCEKEWERFLQVGIDKLIAGAREEARK